MRWWLEGHPGQDYLVVWVEGDGPPPPSIENVRGGVRVGDGYLPTMLRMIEEGTSAFYRPPPKRGKRKVK